MTMVRYGGVCCQEKEPKMRSRSEREKLRTACKLSIYTLSLCTSTEQLNSLDTNKSILSLGSKKVHPAFESSSKHAGIEYGTIRTIAMRFVLDTFRVHVVLEFAIVSTFSY